MTNANLDAWYLPTCPPWCDHAHGGILTPDDDPATFDSPETQPYVCHTRRLAASGRGLAVMLGQWEAHPAAAPTDGGPLTFLTLPHHHDTEGVRPEVLRTWARVLDAAATEAEALAEGAR